MGRFISTKHIETALRNQAAYLRDLRNGRQPDAAELAEVAFYVRDAAARLQSIADAMEDNRRRPAFPRAFSALL